MNIRFMQSLVLAGAMLFPSSAAFAQVDVAVNIAPPELPAYEQPESPGDGYIWTPGYWAWDGEYYWVPGTWVMPPETGYLWTPGYWGWGNGGYLFNEGYWGLSVGFYGGINYGFGYYGRGYEGGRWENGRFFYNTAATRVGGDFRNVYNNRVNEGNNRVSFNGGRGGIDARANSEEQAARQGRRMGAASAQTQHAYSARGNPQQRFSANQGSPAITGTSRANIATHPNQLPPVDRFSGTATGNNRVDQRNQQQQTKLAARQSQDRQNLQQRQDREHQQLTRQNAAPARMQQVEQQHQAQTQQMHQQHQQQSQQMQQRQAPAGGGRPGGGGRGRN